MSLLMTKGFMAGTFLVKGISKLSQLVIDADKDWAGYGITNLKEIAMSMAKGDQPQGGSIVVLTPGGVGTVLTSQGPGNDLIWS